MHLLHEEEIMAIVKIESAVKNYQVFNRTLFYSPYFNSFHYYLYKG